MCIMRTKKNRRENIQLVVYNLVYPALLGSMMYGVFDINWTDWTSYFCTYKASHIVKIGIIFFYLFDYYHLYSFMDKVYTKEQKMHPIYMIFDMLVAGLLVIAFYTYNVFPRFSILLICFVPICFLAYNIMLFFKRLSWQPKTLGFYVPYSIAFVLGGIACLYFHHIIICSEFIAPLFILFMIFCYGVYVWTKQKCEKQEFVFLSSDEGNRYKASVIGKFEEIFEKQDIVKN